MLGQFNFSTSRRWVVIGNPGSPRITLFNSALQREGFSAARVISWLDWIQGRIDLSLMLRAGDCVRIESPGRDFEVERAILTAGVEAAEAEGCATIGLGELASLTPDKGKILCPRQWYLGFSRLLERLKHELASIADLLLMNDPDEISLMFDKPSCHQTMLAAGISVPPCLGPIQSFNDLIACMTTQKARRVFIKLANGSSGSGVVAYQTDGKRHLAWTTVETVSDEQGNALYNTRKLRRLTDQAEIGRLIDLLCTHRVQVERWLPKAGMNGMAFDLRVVMIAQRPAHAVARLSHTPVTNLHLLNQRRDAATVRKHVGEDAWNRAMQSCLQVIRLFPRSLHAGIDLLVSPDFKKSAILEINAFGDQLPGTLHEGLETYDAEIRAVVAGRLAKAGAA